MNKIDSDNEEKVKLPSVQLSPPRQCDQINWLNPSLDRQSMQKKRTFAPSISSDTSNSVRHQMTDTLMNSSATSTQTQAMQSRYDNDEFEVFGKYVASELRHMNLSDARALKVKLNMVMSNGIYEAMNLNFPKI